MTLGWKFHIYVIFQVSGNVFNQWKLFTQATSDVHLKRAAVLMALCLYLGEDDGHLIHEYTVNKYLYFFSQFWM